MKRSALALGVVAVLAVCSTRASASSIQQPPVWTGNGANVGIGWTSETANGTGWVAFDNFSFASTTTINHATWYGVFLDCCGVDALPNTSRWDVLIDGNGPGGTPDSLIGGELNAPTVRTTVGTGFFGSNPVTVYRFDADFTEFTAAAGTTYWFAPVSVGVGGNSLPAFVWIQGTGGDGSSFQVHLSGLNPDFETFREGDRALSLSEVPEPTTLTLLGGGLAAAALRRRFRRA